MRGIDCRVWSWIVRMDVKTEGGACGEWTRMATRTTAESGYGYDSGLCQIPTGGRWLGAVVVTLERVGNCQGDGLHHLSRVHCPGSVMEYEAVKALCCGKSICVDVHGYTLVIDRRTAWEKKNNKRAWVDWWRVRNGMGSDSWGRSSTVAMPRMDNNCIGNGNNYNYNYILNYNNNNNSTTCDTSRCDRHCTQKQENRRVPLASCSSSHSPSSSFLFFSIPFP